VLDQIIAVAPERWRELLGVLLAPIIWIPRMQQLILEFFLDSSSPWWLAAGKYVFLLFPVLLWVAALWSTQFSLYTLPFRSRRLNFLSTIMLTWWDGARMVWLYWVGVFRIGAVLVGWGLTLARLAVKMILEAVHQIALIPFTMTGRMTSNYFQPGVPWVAFLMLLFWCLLESTIFTYILFPTMSEVLADLVGSDQTVPFLQPVLFLFLLLLIMGSFACVQALMDAIKGRDFKFIIQIVIVELFVMFFEVLFLYRELIDAITPWIAQQTGEKFKMGIVFTLSLGVFGWVGIRGMTWFLFGRYGTPPLLAFISRRPMAEVEGEVITRLPAAAKSWWQSSIEDFKREIDWLHAKSDELTEYLILPVLHILAAALNFGMVVLTSRPVFSLPFRDMKVVLQTGEILDAMYPQPKKGSSP